MTEIVAITHPPVQVRWWGHARILAPGVTVSVTIAMAATFISDHHGGPTLLYALLLGMAFHFLSQDGKMADGIGFSGRTILRVGVALLGARISLAQIAALGMKPVAVAVIGAASTVLFGRIAARVLGLGPAQGLLTGGAVGICGASAALAISAVLPRHQQAERDTIFTVVAVTALSTTAMIFYPMLAKAMGLHDVDAGMFLGATIHDVAQVVGAGYIISDAAGNVATVTKLLRVAMLVPVVMTITTLVARWPESRMSGGRKGPRLGLPGFLVAFVVIVVANSALPPHEGLISAFNATSRWCLVIAMAAIGMKTSFQELASMGWRPAALVISETVFLACLAATMILLWPQ